MHAVEPPTDEATTQDPGDGPEPLEPRYDDFALGTGVVLLVAASALWLMGRELWCSCGSANPVSLDVWSKHNSQHLLDPYTFTHVLHGFAYYALLTLALRRWTSPLLRFFLAISLEAIWEVLENTEWVINAYREATISLDYFGDSVANSLSDVAACAVGFVLARRLPVPASVGTFIGVEVTLLLWIRDSLTLNVLMLLWPLEAVKSWQMGG